MTRNDLHWRRSSHCESNACVEIAVDGDHVLMRRSTDPDGPILSFTRSEWDAFIAAVKAQDTE